MRNFKVYYAVVNKNTLKVGVFLEKSQVCEYISKSLYTFNKGFVGGKYEDLVYCVQFVDEMRLKSARGDHSGRNLGEHKR
jgi:hypothetical protein